MQMDEANRVGNLAKGPGYSAGVDEIRLGKLNRGRVTREGACFSGQRSLRVLAAGAAAALVLALALPLGCGGRTEATPENGGRVRGLVVAVEGRNITELESLAIRDEAGKIWTFTSDAGFVGFTPSHLREHQLQGHPVAVTYVVEGDTLVVVDIAD
jgi:hypothetical protein|tara:strand:+ start:148 stop:615 length:468 start_codon:yes stop_codon:yes gene_type:complete